MRFYIPLLLPVFWLFTYSSAFAAGGHHAVDDARILDPGHCHVENWGEIHRRGGYFINVGPACHFAGAEWTLGLERDHVDDARDWVLTPQVKTAMPLGYGNWHIGAIVGGSWRDDERRFDNGYFIVPLSWISDPIEFHFNVGYDVNRDERDDWRYGASVYGNLFGPVDGVLEIFNEADEWFGQVGFRWNVVPDTLMFDVSVAQSEYRNGDRWVTLGLTYEFSR
jgi:hypothetical protein